MTVDLDPDSLRATVQAAREGSPDAWERIYRHCYPRLMNYAMRRLPERAAADDAVSEALARAMRSIDRFDWSGGGFDAWLYGILRNVVHEDRRKRSRSHDLVERSGREQRAGDRRRDDPESAAERSDDRAALLRAFGSLSESDRELLELRVIGELSAAETGLVLGKNEGAVRTAQSRALERLRQAMEELGHD